jgi:hypothetical protein
MQNRKIKMYTNVYTHTHAHAHTHARAHTHTAARALLSTYSEIHMAFMKAD